MSGTWRRLGLPAALLVAGAAFCGWNLQFGGPSGDAYSDALEPSATPRLYRLEPGRLLLATTEDSIPSIEARPSNFVTRSDGDQEWQDAESVIGLVLGGQAKAYPIRLLSLHEIVNDRVADVPVAVTWCPLCYSAIVFDRHVAGQVLTFDVSGYLLESNLVMIDRQTRTLWSQVLGQSLRGPLRRSWLEILPSQLVTWGDWKAAHPDALVLSATRLGYDPDVLADPYAGYYTSGAVGLAGELDDDRLPAKALIVGLTQAGQALALLPEQVRQAWPLHLRLGDRPLVAGYDQSLEAVIVYVREVNGDALHFDRGAAGELVDRQSGSVWRLADGRAVAGPLDGRQLTRVPATPVFWFAWSALYPHTTIYGQQ